MLMCRFNPDDDSDDPQMVATEETNPKDFKHILHVFTDEALDDAPRTLSQWHDIVITRKLKHHSWIDNYKAAKTEVLSVLDSRLTRLEAAHEDIQRNGKEEQIKISAAKIEALRAELDSLRDAPQKNVLIAPELSQLLGTPSETPPNPDATSQDDDLATEIAAGENANQPDCETPSPEQKNFLDSEPDTPDEGGKWWQTDYDILELAQDYGYRLVNEKKKPSQNAVATKVANHINKRELIKTPLENHEPRTISTTALKKGPMKRWEYTSKK
jgi:hypothetical protein